MKWRNQKEVSTPQTEVERADISKKAANHYEQISI